jgi:proteasome lid subunit RPN8/RPN11
VLYRFAPEVGRRVAELLASAGRSEFCGFLVGRCGPHICHVDVVLSVWNAGGFRDGFAIADSGKRWAEREAARLGLELLAVVHSHPGGTRALSRADREGILISDLPWAIVVRAGSTADSILCLVYEPGTARLVQTVVVEGTPVRPA